MPRSAGRRPQQDGDALKCAGRQHIHGGLEQSGVGGLKDRADQDDTVSGGQGIDHLLQVGGHRSTHTGQGDVLDQGPEPDDLDAGQAGVGLQGLAGRLSQPLGEHLRGRGFRDPGVQSHDPAQTSHLGIGVGVIGRRSGQGLGAPGRGDGRSRVGGHVIHLLPVTRRVTGFPCHLRSSPSGP